MKTLLKNSCVAFTTHLIMTENKLSNCQVQFWKDQNLHGKSTGPITGPGKFKLHDFDRMKDEASSMQTGPNTWAVCYDDKNSFSGPSFTVGPNTTIDYLTTEILAREGDNTVTWDNKIGAVELFNSDPNA